MITHDTPRFDDENVQREIEKLIVDETDPKEKVRLLMLMQLNSTLLNNVVAVRNLTKEFKEHRIEFENHVKTEEESAATKRGAMWAIMAFLGIVQALFVYIYTTHTSNSDVTQKLALDTASIVRVHEERIRGIDEKLGKLLDKLDKVSSNGK